MIEKKQCPICGDVGRVYTEETEPWGLPCPNCIDENGEFKDEYL